MDKLVAGAGLVLGHVLQVDGLLQEDLPLDTGPVVSLNRIDDLHPQSVMVTEKKEKEAEDQ